MKTDENERTCVYLFTRKISLISKGLVSRLSRNRVALKDGNEDNKQKRVVALIIECAGNAMTCITLEMIVYNKEGSSTGMANLVA